MKSIVRIAAALAFLIAARSLCAIEEHIRGVLEKTAKEGACAQITDALNEVYYVIKTPESEKLCNQFSGQRVVLTGTVEQRGGDPAYLLSLSKVEPYQPKPPEKGSESSGASLPLPPPPKAPKTGD